MKITLELPRKLINEAMKVTGSKSLDQFIESALKAQIKEAKRIKLVSLKGSIDLNLDLDTLRKRI